MTTTLPELEVPDPALVARGRRIFLTVTGVFVAMEGLRALAAPYTEVDIARVLLGIGLFYAAWHGRQWAITLVALSLPLGALLSFVLGMAYRSLAGFAIGTAIALLYGGLFLLFVKSESLNAFFRHQAPPLADASVEEEEGERAEALPEE